MTAGENENAIMHCPAKVIGAEQQIMPEFARILNELTPVFRAYQVGLCECAVAFKL